MGGMDGVGGVLLNLNLILCFVCVFDVGGEHVLRRLVFANIFFVFVFLV